VSTPSKRILAVLGVPFALILGGMICLSFAVSYSGPADFTCNGPANHPNCGDSNHASALFRSLFFGSPPDTVVSSPALLWIARVCLFAVLAAVLFVIVAGVATKAGRGASSERRRLMRQARARRGA
jgi:hypothetical protein